MAQDECCPADDVPGVTDDLLSDFLVGNSLRGVLDDVTRIAEEEADLEALRRRMAALEELRIIDFACGPGAFLVSAYQALLTLHEGLLQLSGPQDLLSHEAAMTQARLLRSTLYGADLLPQAVEIAKPALLLRSARKGERSSTWARISCPSTRRRMKTSAVRAT